MIKFCNKNGHFCHFNLQFPFWCIKSTNMGRSPTLKNSWIRHRGTNLSLNRQDDMSIFSPYKCRFDDKADEYCVNGFVSIISGWLSQLNELSNQFVRQLEVVWKQWKLSYFSHHGVHMKGDSYQSSIACNFILEFIMKKFQSFLATRSFSSVFHWVWQYYDEYHMM